VVSCNAGSKERSFVDVVSSSSSSSSWQHRCTCAMPPMHHSSWNSASRARSQRWCLLLHVS
jgi:hypothetical protein